MLDTHFTSGPHSRDCVERASRAHKVKKALAGSLYIPTETLVGMYKAIVYYTMPPHLVRKRVLLPSACINLKWSIIRLWGSRLAARTTEPWEACDSEVVIFRSVPGEGTYPLARRLLRARIIEEIVRSQPLNKVLCLPPPHQWTQSNSCCLGPSVQPFLCFAPATAEGFSPTVTPKAGPTTIHAPTAMPQITRGVPPLQLFHTCSGSHPGGYVGGTPPGRSVLGGPPTVCQSASTPDRFRLLSLLTLLCK